MFSLFIVFTIATLISTGRVPFDLAEAESELISGVSTELGGISFSLLLIFDYVELLFLLSIVIQSIVIYDQVVVFVVLAILVCYIGRIVLCRYLLVDIIKLVYVILFWLLGSTFAFAIWLSCSVSVTSCNNVELLISCFLSLH